MMQTNFEPSPTTPRHWQVNFSGRGSSPNDPNESPVRPPILPTHSHTNSSSSPPSAATHHSHTSSIASTISQPPSPGPHLSHLSDFQQLSTSRVHSPALSHSSSSQQLVLHGAELVAFTGALREMLRTNHVRATRQAALNETNSQLHAMNFFLHFMNAERSQKLEREYASVRESIESGRQLLSQMTSVIASQDEALTQLGTTVSTLESQAEEQHERVTSIEDAMIEQKQQLALAMAEYEQRLSAQEQEFRRQEAVLARLLSVRFKLDFGLDMLLLLLGWYGSHNGLITVVLEFLSKNIFFRGGGRRMRNRRSRLFVSVIELVFFALLVRKLRQLALENGLHHAIGGYTKYVQFIARTCGSAVEMVRGGGKSATTLDNEAIEEQQNALAATSPSSTTEPIIPASAPVPPEYSTSAALSLGRGFGSFMLNVLSTSRDSVKYVLNRVVGTGAADPDEDEHHSITAASTSSTSSHSTAPPAPHSSTTTPPHSQTVSHTRTGSSESDLYPHLHATNTTATHELTQPTHLPTPSAPLAPSALNDIHSHPLAPPSFHSSAPHHRQVIQETITATYEEIDPDLSKPM